MELVNARGDMVNGRGADPKCWKCKGSGFTKHRSEKRQCFCVTGDKAAAAAFYQAAAMRSRKAFVQLMHEHDQLLEMGDRMNAVIKRYREFFQGIQQQFTEGDGI